MLCMYDYKISLDFSKFTININFLMIKNIIFFTDLNDE